MNLKWEKGAWVTNENISLGVLLHALTCFHAFVSALSLRNPIYTVHLPQHNRAPRGRGT